MRDPEDIISSLHFCWCHFQSVYSEFKESHPDDYELIFEYLREEKYEGRTARQVFNDLNDTLARCTREYFRVMKDFESIRNHLPKANSDSEGT